MPSRVAIAIALAFAVTPPASAQMSLPACPSQQDIEQVLQSQGQLVPDDCRTVTITTIQTPAGELCVLDFEEEDTGIVGAITEAAVPTQWWVACADIERP